MESELNPMHNSDSEEPNLTVVEGESSVDIPAESSIVPNAFETVLAQYDEAKAPKYVEPEAPAYKNRAFIAAICIVGGIVAGRLTTQPKVETRIVTKDAPITAAQGTSVASIPKVDNAFRDLEDLKDFDPWQPMNGGFPLPPKATQANIVSRGGSSNFEPAPPSLQGNITPMNPNDVVGPLPQVGGPGISLPANPEPGGKTSTENGKVVLVEATSKTDLGREKYISMNVSGSDPVQGQSSLTKLAASLGGSARTFSHMLEDGTAESQGVLLIIPASKFETARTKIEALGGATIDANVDGIASGEQTRIQSIFTARLTRLREKQKDLLVDFLEDAQPVKQVKEAIDLESRAVAATRLPGGLAGKVVIRVMLK